MNLEHLEISKSNAICRKTSEKYQLMIGPYIGIRDRFDVLPALVDNFRQPIILSAQFGCHQPDKVHIVDLAVVVHVGCFD